MTERLLQVGDYLLDFEHNTCAHIAQPDKSVNLTDREMQVLAMMSPDMYLPTETIGARLIMVDSLIGGYELSSNWDKDRNLIEAAKANVGQIVDRINNKFKNNLGDEVITNHNRRYHGYKLK